MGPGPCNPYPEVAAAFARPLLGHLDPDFIDLLDETSDRLRQVFRTANPLTFPVSGTGSAGMEAAFVNVVGPGDVAVIGVNGRVRRAHVRRGRPRPVPRWCGSRRPGASRWIRRRLLDAHPSPQVIAAVHAETSTGVRNDMACLGQAQRHQDAEALVLVDCVTSLGGIPVEIDGWQVDVAYSGTQKCLGVPPGSGPADHRAPGPSSAWSSDPSRGTWTSACWPTTSTGEGARVYHHTAPVVMIFALHAGLGALLDEGLEASWAGTASAARLSRPAWRPWASSCSRPRATACPS